MAKRKPEPARLLVADPPWSFRDALPGEGRGAAKHYQCLSLDEIKAFPLPALADDCLLLLWRVASMQQEALDVVRAWGFSPVKSELVWVKAASPDEAQQRARRAFWRSATPTHLRDPFLAGVSEARRLRIGMGHYVRNAHETCLIARRGKAKVDDRAIPSVLFAPRGRHSAKPIEFYEACERMSPGPYHELFARQRRPGWRCEGNEVPVEG